MNIELRLEQPADYREVELLVREAFWNVYMPGCYEHYLVHIMRHAPRFVRELDYVAVAGGTIVGHIAYVKSLIHADDGSRHEVLTLGPIAVLPEYQRMGIGRKLIEHTRIRAAASGHRAILLCGDPEYYSRMGFEAAERWGIRADGNIYLDALQAYPLRDDALEGMSGIYREDAVYDIDPAEAEAFDRLFPTKERLADTPSQRRFQELVAMQRPGPQDKG